LITIENALNIFTDGSSRNSPRAGGIGIRFVINNALGDDIIQDLDFAGYRGATNNQMELHACNVALKEAKKLDLPPNITKVVIHSDSLYVVENHKRAMFEWPKTRWLSRSGRPILNADLWKELIKRIQKMGMRVEIRWVKGHSKSEHNKAADKLARSSSRIPLNKPLTHVNVRKKKSDKLVAIGSVEMHNQRITIRIITSEHLDVQRLWKYRYEVVSQQNKYGGNVDFIFSEHFLSPAHTYSVRVNSDTSNPRIEKVYREINPKEH
jgi:ribonuclease HI